MGFNKENHNHQLEINDLIDETVNNAVARRNDALDTTENLSDEETKNITGGASLSIRFPIVLGIIYYPPDITIAIDQTIKSV
jgi:hypothetical protein